MRPLAFENGSKQRTSDGCASRVSASASPAMPASVPRCVVSSGPDDLGDNQRVKLVVPDEIRLVAPPATQESDGMSAGSDQVAFGKAPGVHLPVV